MVLNKFQKSVQRLQIPAKSSAIRVPHHRPQWIDGTREISISKKPYKPLGKPQWDSKFEHIHWNNSNGFSLSQNPFDDE